MKKLDKTKNRFYLCAAKHDLKIDNSIIKIVFWGYGEGSPVKR